VPIDDTDPDDYDQDEAMAAAVSSLRETFRAIDGTTHDDTADVDLVKLAATRLRHAEDDHERRATFWASAATILGRKPGRGMRDEVLAILREHAIPTPPADDNDAVRAAARRQIASRHADQEAVLAERQRREREALAAELGDPNLCSPSWVQTGRDTAEPVADGGALAILGDLGSILDELRGMRSDQRGWHVDAMQHMTWCVEESLAATIERAVDGAAVHVADAVRETGEDLADDVTDAIGYAAPQRRRRVVFGVRGLRWQQRREARQEATQGQDEAPDGR
jgi:hypothetical protein